MSRLHRIAPLTLAAVLALIARPVPLSGQARLQYTTTPAIGESQPLVLSISGGISLGAYQAGVNWGLLELYRTANTYADFAALYRIPKSHLGAIAGASAGNINTLLWAIEACTKARRLPPDSSLFWQVWTSVGLEQLLPEHLPPDSLDKALFDRTYFREVLFPLIEKRMDSGDLERGCFVRLGITLTRILPGTLHLDNLPIQTQRYATFFGAGIDRLNGGPMRFWRRGDDADLLGDRSFGKLVAPPRDSSLHVPRDTVFKIVQASSAFPLAFQPVELTMYHPGERRQQSDGYLDGGLFDNNPVGLALDLYLASFARTLRNGRIDTVSVVYVNPGRLRGELDSVRTRKPPEVARGGLRSVLQMAAGAIGTARQYELQLWARGGGIPDPDTVTVDGAVVRDTVLVRMTSRAHPLVGEHLHAFAAFLGRPFREYDFYVGLYDAFDFIAREYACRGEAGDPRGCVASAVADLIASPRIDGGAGAARLLGALFEREYREDRFAVLRRRLRDVASREKSMEDADRATIMLALLEAQETQYDTGAPSCANDPLPELVLCADRLGSMVRAFAAADGVLPILERRWRECEERYPEEKETNCAEERNFYDFVREPERYTARLIDRILDRWLLAERRLRRERERDARAAGLDPDTLPRLDAETTVEVLVSLYRARPLRPRRGFEWSTTSAPDGAWLAHIVPDHAGAVLGSRGIELAYRPTLHLSNKLAVFAPLTWHRATVPLPLSAGAPGNDDRSYLGGGLGFAVKGALGPPVGLLVPEFGVDVQRLGPTSRWWDDGAWMGGLYADFSLIAGRLRFAFRCAEPDGPLFGGDRCGVFAGLADLGGLGYWLLKIAR